MLQSTQRVTPSIFDRFANVCTAFGVTISLKKKSLPQSNTSPKITINIYELKVVQQFVYLGSTITSKLSLERELTDELVWQPLHLPVLVYVCGKIPDSRSRQR